MRKNMKNYKIMNRQPAFDNRMMQLKDSFKQNISVLGKGIIRYNTNYRRRNDKRLFHNNEKQFCTSLEVGNQNGDPHGTFLR